MPIYISCAATSLINPPKSPGFQQRIYGIKIKQLFNPVKKSLSLSDDSKRAKLKVTRNCFFAFNHIQLGLYEPLSN